MRMNRKEEPQMAASRMKPCSQGLREVLVTVNCAPIARRCGSLPSGAVCARAGRAALNCARSELQQDRDRKLTA